MLSTLILNSLVYTLILPLVTFIIMFVMKKDINRLMIINGITLLYNVIIFILCNTDLFNLGLELIFYWIMMAVSSLLLIINLIIMTIMIKTKKKEMTKFDRSSILILLIISLVPYAVVFPYVIKNVYLLHDAKYIASFDGGLFEVNDNFVITNDKEYEIDLDIRKYTKEKTKLEVDNYDFYYEYRDGIIEYHNEKITNNYIMNIINNYNKTYKAKSYLEIYYFEKEDYIIIISDELDVLYKNETEVLKIDTDNKGILESIYILK